MIQDKRTDSDTFDYNSNTNETLQRYEVPYLIKIQQNTTNSLRLYQQAVHIAALFPVLIWPPYAVLFSFNILCTVSKCTNTCNIIICAFTCFVFGYSVKTRLIQRDWYFWHPEGCEKIIVRKYQKHLLLDKMIRFCKLETWSWQHCWYSLECYL